MPHPIITNKINEKFANEFVTRLLLLTFYYLKTKGFIFN